ncbi:MAG: penicillin-binding protein 2 [Chloroflexota bacterium]|nr:penicillin-binding protein 2 [Chloroflexota bacterium]
MKKENAHRLRFLVVRVIVVAAFAIVAFRFWELQVTTSQKYARSADRNRFRLVPIDAPRGIMYDRFGRALVKNVPSFSVSIVPSELPEDKAQREAVLERVGELLEIPVHGKEAEGEDVGTSTLDTMSIEEMLETRTISPYAPVRIVSGIDRQAAFIIEEEHMELPGVIVSAEPLRHYTYGPLAAHILGYVGHISKDRLAAYVDEGYEPDDMVGVAGLELSQEHHLRGIDGQKHVECDAFGREVAVLASKPPVPGDNIILTIDIELQREVAEALRKGMRRANSSVGVAIVMDPRTGEVLSMVSLPSYDNNLFSGGISREDYARLSEDPAHPLMNHGISGQYPPGSTFKIVPACGALEEGVLTPSTRLNCRGTLLLPYHYAPEDTTKAQKFYCWYRPGHGRLNIVEAIRQSCDIFFYQVAGGYEDFEGLGMEKLADYAREFGFGKPTGIELSGEATGLVPSDQWKRQNYGENWVTGDTYNAAIGQGYILATPLQVLNATAAVANGGVLYRPQLIYQVLDAEGDIVHVLQPDPIRELAISEENISLVRQGMREAVTRGTAWLLDVPSAHAAGKTGTAEYPGLDEEGNLMLDEEGNLPTHAWFTAFAPYEAPEVVLVVFLEGGGEGSQMAVPVAADILRAYFGLSQPTPVPTETIVQGG